MAKYLIDASVIASSLEDFKRRFISQDNTLVLSDLTFRELEARKKDKGCSEESKKFVRFLIDFFVRDISSSEICSIESETSSKHIDEELVKYAKSNNMYLLTCDKGMALWCRFYGVECTLLESRSITKLPFVIESNNAVYLNLYDGSIPRAHSVYVYSPARNATIPPVSRDLGTIFLNPGYIVLVAHPENRVCSIDTYFVNRDRATVLVAKDLYSSEEDIDTDDKTFHKELFRKWKNYVSKLT